MSVPRFAISLAYAMALAMVTMAATHAREAQPVDQVDALIGKLETVAGKAVVGNPADVAGGSAAGLSTARYLEGAYAGLEASVENADAAPTIDEIQAAAGYSKQLDGIIAKW